MQSAVPAWQNYIAFFCARCRQWLPSDGSASEHGDLVHSFVFRRPRVTFGLFFKDWVLSHPLQFGKHEPQ